MRHSMAAPRQAPRSCVERQRRAGGDLHLQPHQVEAGHQLGDGMLHLQARVHFQEVEAAVLVHQEFHRAGVVVAGGARGAHGGFAHGAAHLRMLRHQRRRALLDHLLMAALDGALALAQVDHVAVAVAEDLDFDVARALDQLLDVDFGVAEGALGFARGIAESGFQLRSRIHAAHAFAAAAGHGLEQNGIAVLARRTRGLLPASTPCSVPGTTGAPPAMAARRAAVFEPMARMESADGPMKTSPASSQAAAKSAFSLRKP